ncbi:MAG: response regulator transcription factor [Acetobacteraceae bacterium]|nr:response regulator transcription factor [Acetobacteraceae bacterium]
MSTPATLAHAAVAILSAIGPSGSDEWLEQQVTWLRAHRANLPIIAIIDAVEQNEAVERMLQLGLQGYIPTTSGMEVAAAVLHLVAAGGTYIPHFAEPASAPQPVPEKSPAVAAAGLTPRERKVLELLELGMSNKTIAYRLSLSESTVKVHVHRILSKFKVHNRTEAVVVAYQRYGRHPGGARPVPGRGDPQAADDSRSPTLASPRKIVVT